MQPGYDDVAMNDVRAIQTNDFILSVLFHLCTLRHADSLWAPAALNPASHIPPSLHRSYAWPKTSSKDRTRCASDANGKFVTTPQGFPAQQKYDIRVGHNK